MLSRRWFAATAVLGTAYSLQSAQMPGEQQAAFRTTSNLVLLEVSVLDANGVPVAGLEKQNFQIKESGRPRQISHFATGAEQVCVGLLVDFSRSMRAQQELVSSAVAQFSARLQPADELFLVLFNESILVESEPKLLAGTKPQEVANVISSTRPDGQTALYDALLKGAELSRRGSLSRRVLVILSDGADTASRASLEDAIAAIHSSNLLIYTVGMPARGTVSSGLGVLKRLAESTGGFTVADPGPEALSLFFDRVSADIRARYVIGYMAVEPPPGKTETRSLSVDIVHPPVRSIRIKARKKYRIQATGVL
ncbi:MAG: VWA domain-containing protein [Acidobacteriota bacterium]